MVAESDITSVVDAERDPEAAATQLVEAANEAGGVDNITAVVIDIETDDDDDADEPDDSTADTSDGESDDPPAGATGDEPPVSPDDEPDADAVADDGTRRGLRRIFGRGS
jgi:hypothetical protein